MNRDLETVLAAADNLRELVQDHLPGCGEKLLALTCVDDAARWARLAILGPTGETKQAEGRPPCRAETREGPAAVPG